MKIELGDENNSNLDNLKIRELSILHKRDRQEMQGGDSSNSTVFNDKEYKEYKKRWEQLEHQTNVLKNDIRTAIIPTDPLGINPAEYDYMGDDIPIFGKKEYMQGIKNLS